MYHHDITIIVDRGVDVAVECGGLAVTLIDFTLSRLRTAAGDVAFCDLAADPELFAGPKGDCQVGFFPSQIHIVGSL